MRKVGRITVGILLVLIGIVGIIMPIMPGWSLLLPGLVLLEDQIPGLRRLLDGGVQWLVNSRWDWLRRGGAWLQNALLYCRTKAGMAADPGQ